MNYTEAEMNKIIGDRLEDAQMVSLAAQRLCAQAVIVGILSKSQIVQYDRDAYFANKVMWIKALRAHTGCSLKEGKEAVDIAINLFDNQLNILTIPIPVKCNGCYRANLALYKRTEESQDLYCETCVRETRIR